MKRNVWLAGLASMVLGVASLGAHAEGLVEAVKSGDEDAVRSYLAQGGDVDAASPEGTTALMWAVHGHNPHMAQLLIEAGAGVFNVNRYGMTALHLAARTGDVASTRLLLAAGADANGSLPEGETVLMAAAKSGHPDVVGLLLSGGADVDGTLPQGEVQAYNAADPNAKESWHGQTALMWAAAGGHTEAMRRLIAAGAYLDETSSLIDAPEIEPDRRQGGFVYAKIPRGSMTALHLAAREGQVESVRTLIEAGADLDATDAEDSTALILAAVNGYLDIAELLLESGADPNVADRFGRTILFVATDMHTLDANPRPPPRINSRMTPVGLVNLSLAKGAEVDAPLKTLLPQWCAQGCTHNPVLAEGATALLRTAMSGDVEIMRILLEAGADPNIVTVEQEITETDAEYENVPPGQTTPFMAAAGVGWRDTISRGRDADAIEALKILLELGGDINQANQAGDTPLHGAALRGSVAIIEFLVEHGADVMATNWRGWTPLDIAMGQPDQRIPYNEATTVALRALMPAETELSSVTGESSNSGG